MQTYYAYVHTKPTNEGAHSIFYVGKGTRRRAHLLNRTTRNSHYSNTVCKYGIENIAVGKIECSSERVAFDLEKGLIKCLRRMGVSLTNLTDGGEGSSGYKPTGEQLSRLSAVSKARWADENHRSKMIAAQTKAQRALEVSEKKLKASLTNAEKGRAVLMTADGKKSAAKKNSKKSLSMWADSNRRDVIVRAMKDVWTSEMREAKGQEIRGRKRVTNGEFERNVKPEEVEKYLAMGWREGRKVRASNKRPRSNKKNQLKGIQNGNAHPVKRPS